MSTSETENLALAKPLRRRDTFFDEGFLVIITGLGNAFNFVFHIYMSRNLGQDGYSELNSLISFLYVLSVPIVTIQTTITKFVAQFIAKDEHANVRRLFVDSLKRVGILGFVLAGAMVIGTPYIRDFLNIENNVVILISALLVFVMFMMPVIWAVLQGREQFGFLGFSYFVNFTAKCGIGILFAILGWGVGGVLFGVVLAFVASLLVVIWPMRDVLAPTLDEDTIDNWAIYKFALPVVVSLFFLSWFCNIDIGWVRHFYGHTDEGLTLSGYYASASIVGKSFLFLPIGIVLALIPKVSRMKAKGEDPLPILIRGLALDIGLSVIGIVASFILARHLALFLTKTDAHELVALIKYFGVAITPIAATMILVNYNLANESYRFMWLLVPITVLTFTTIWFIHSTPHTVLLIMGFGGFALFFSILALTVLTHKATASQKEIEPSA